MSRYYLVTDHGKYGRIPVHENKMLEVPHNRELYTSIYQFDHEFVDYIDSVGSISGYDGAAYGHHLIFDFDGDCVEEVAVAIAPIIQQLYEYKIVHYLFRSGKKGFHLYIPKDYVEYPEEFDHKWDILSKAAVAEVVNNWPEVTPYLDDSVYFKQAIFRAPYSIHPDTQLAKQALTFNGTPEGEPLTLENIRHVYGINSRDKHDIMSEIYHGIYMPQGQSPDEYFINLSAVDFDKFYKQPTAVSVPAAQDESPADGPAVRTPFSGKPCITAMYNTRHLTGQRHVVSLRLMIDLYERGWPAEYARAILTLWGSNLTEPVPQEDIDRDLQYYGKYTYTCNDTIKSQFCQSDCQYYKLSKVEEEHMFFGERYATELEASMNMPTTNDIYLGRIFPEFQHLSAIKPDRGHVTVICAGPSAGKTTLALNLMLKYRHINWLFMSYEMAATDIAEKLWLMHFGNLIITKERKKEFAEATKHIITWDDPTVNIDDVQRVWRYVRNMIGVECRAVVMDYVQIIPTRGVMATERAISIAKSVKNLAKRLKVAPILLSQVPKELAGDGNIPLPMQAAKDSGEITNLADIQLNIWRPQRLNPVCVDDQMTILVAKDRHGASDEQVDLHFDGASYRIKSGWTHVKPKAA